MADVLIRGMKMPKSCWDCKFNASTIDHYELCILTKKTYSWGLTKPPSDCPIIEVPDGHGDLIDRDELLAELHLYRERLGAGFSANEVTSVMNRIRNQKTIIPAEPPKEEKI